MSPRFPRRRVVGFFLAGLAGCARSDWVESTLVTVDVTGEWTGSWTTTGGGVATLTMSLRQAGGKVTGVLATSGWNAAKFPTGEFGGTVAGDVLRFVSGGRRFDLIVAGDEMRGNGHHEYGSATVEFRRR